MRIIGAGILRNKLKYILDLAQAGETIYIQRNDKVFVLRLDEHMSLERVKL